MNLVDVGEVVDRISLLVLVVNANFVMQDVMKTYVAEFCDSFYLAQIAAIALPQREYRSPGTERLLPEMRERMARSASID
jgi:hypothetical protein